VALAILLVVVCFGVVMQNGGQAAKVYTTVDRTLLPSAVKGPAIHPYDISEFSQYGYGSYQYGPGLAYDLRTDLMPAGYVRSNLTSSSLLRFFAMTDVHLTDKESPAQAVYFGIRPNGIISAYSPAMLYSTQMLDAAVRTANEIDKKDSMDFGVFLGDLGNCGQRNEVRWFINVLDGKTINPDSGAKDDPVPGPGNDYQDEFKAAGLDPSIPWYAALGNHDHFWMGMNPPTGNITEALVGSNILKIGNIFAPDGIYGDNYYVGTIDGSTVYGTPIGAGPVNSTSPFTVASDQNRRFLTVAEWMNEFSNSTSSPNGHGFSGLDPGFACYTFDPDPNAPIRIIVLDDTQSANDQDLNGYGHGTLDQARYDWLVSQLDKAQAEDKLIIIAAHIPIGVEPSSSPVGWSSQAAVSEADLIAKLHTYPNLLMWAAGHRHLNNVTAMPSTDPAHPEQGFWVVETSSLREYPQQFRTFDLKLNSDNTLSMFVTDIDPSTEGNSLAEKSRSYALAAYEIFNITPPIQPTGSVSYNAELMKKLTPAMQEKARTAASGSSGKAIGSYGLVTSLPAPMMACGPANSACCHACAGRSDGLGVSLPRPAVEISRAGLGIRSSLAGPVCCPVLPG
jgi:metallophosphoesterase (TIGR03768 family)